MQKIIRWEGKVQENNDTVTRGGLGYFKYIDTLQPVKTGTQKAEEEIRIVQ